MSPNHGERRGCDRPRLVVLHYTGMATAAAARDRLCDPEAEVSAHWLVDETGFTENLVCETRRAWHAGQGAWGGITDVNSHSIGIELANPGDRPFPARQMAALETLLAGVLARWSIPAQNVIGHSDMAPLRKRDPGPRFDWQRLARMGLSVWPNAALGAGAAADFRPALRRFGYPDHDVETLLAAFRLRFRPGARGSISGADAAIAADLARRFPAGMGVDAGPPSA